METSLKHNLPLSKLLRLMITVVEEGLPSSASTFRFAFERFGNIVRERRNPAPSHHISSIVFRFEFRRESCVQLGVGTVYGSFEEEFLESFVSIAHSFRNSKRTMTMGPTVPMLRCSSVRIKPGCTLWSQLASVLNHGVGPTHHAEYSIASQTLREFGR